MLQACGADLLRTKAADPLSRPVKDRGCTSALGNVHGKCIPLWLTTKVVVASKPHSPRAQNRSATYWNKSPIPARPAGLASSSSGETNDWRGGLLSWRSAFTVRLTGPAGLPIVVFARVLLGCTTTGSSGASTQRPVVSAHLEREAEQPRPRHRGLLISTRSSLLPVLCLHVASLGAGYTQKKLPRRTPNTGSINGPPPPPPPLKKALLLLVAASYSSWTGSIALL